LGLVWKFRFATTDVAAVDLAAAEEVGAWGTLLVGIKIETLKFTWFAIPPRSARVYPHQSVALE
jgi:hypothetical protein